MRRCAVSRTTYPRVCVVVVMVGISSFSFFFHFLFNVQHGSCDRMGMVNAILSAVHLQQTCPSRIHSETETQVCPCCTLLSTTPIPSRSPPPSTASQRLDNPLTSMGGLSEDIVRCLTKRDTNRNVQTLLLSSPSLPLALRHLSHLAAHLRALVLKCVHYNDVCSALVQCRHLN